MNQRVTDSEFKTIGIIGKYGDTDVSSTIDKVLQLTNSLNCRILLDQETTQEFYQHKSFNFLDRERLVNQSDLVITVGGDGSFLAAARSVIEKGKPLVGINMGRLGFLTDISPQEVESVLYEILTGKYLKEERTVLFATRYREGKIFSQHTAINDVVIHKSAVARMIELDVYLDDKFLSSYHADGLIVSSPTGSTAYALSSGGPILQSQLEALLLVPICPHTLTQRPIVIDANTTQTIKISENETNQIQLSIDGQEEILLHTQDSINITKHPKKLTIYHPCDYSQFERLHKKLGWGSKSIA